MSSFKTTLITCQQCGRKIMVRAADAERGLITCSHVGCGTENILSSAYCYDEAIVNGLPEFGQLKHSDEQNKAYTLRLGRNVIGTAASCTIMVPRLVHEGRCFISRRHCTLTVTFDKWLGQLRYQLQDGAADPVTQEHQYSLNGTCLNDIPVQRTELIDVNNGGTITLGGCDRFQLVPYSIAPAMLETYRISLAFDPDRTQ